MSGPSAFLCVWVKDALKYVFSALDEKKVEWIVWVSVVLNGMVKL